MYQAQSPDEAALVDASRRVGVVFEVGDLNIYFIKLIIDLISKIKMAFTF